MVNVIEKEMLSISRIKMFLRCPLQYYFKYVEGIKTPSNGALLLGKSVHKALEVNYKEKVKSRKDLPLDLLYEIHSTSFDELTKAEEVIFDEAEDPGKLKDCGIACLKAYYEEIAPTIFPVEVESHFILEFENVPYAFQGYIDIIDEQGFIRDHKCVKRSYAVNAAEEDIQLTGYNLAFKFLKGKEPTGLVFDCMVKTKVPKVNSVSCGPRSEQQLNRFLKLIGSVSEAMKSGLFYPAEGSMVCSYCDFKDHCRKW
ncbi:MAG: PD-(D/E)XK nuclease family protein [Elusimicrobia bacterium]|nr:PD-(D/E)XK nuclease family protein [Candidatus Liberimonas magnetica]